MLKWLGLAAVVSAAVFCAALVGLMVGYSWQPTAQEGNQQTAAEHEHKQENSEQEKAFWQRATTDPIAAFTLWLVIFTAVLGITSVLQYGSLIRGEVTNAKSAKAAERAAKVAETALVTVQRAFVFIDSFDTGMIGNNLIIHPKWRNSGSTPTKFMTNYVNWKPFEGEPPSGYAFPDLDEHGTIVTGKNRKLAKSFVGPNATTLAYALTIPTVTLDAVREGHLRVFVWGWARYQDVFKASHITRFCNELKMLPLPPPAVPPATGQESKVGAAISFPLYGHYNCTDDECDAIGLN